MANITIEIVENKKDGQISAQSYPSVMEKMAEVQQQETGDRGLLAKSVFVNKAFDIAKQTINNAVEIGINRRVTLQEDYIMGYTWQNVKTTIGSVAQLGSSIYAGTVMGSIAGGPVGAAVGASLAIASYTVNFGTTMYNRRSSIAQQINTANYNMAFQQARLSLVNNSRGTEN